MGREDKSIRKIDLVIHPVRFRILQLLSMHTYCTAELAERLDNVPKSSIYRHLAILLDADLVTVVDSRPVRGVEERFFTALANPDLGEADMAGLSADQHLRYFTTYILTIMRGFDQYLRTAEAARGIDFGRDHAGYREVSFYASDEELEQAIQQMSLTLLPYLSSQQQTGRKLRRLATILFPAESPDKKRE